MLARFLISAIFKSIDEEVEGSHSRYFEGFKSGDDSESGMSF